jgi:hypothetical protein
LIETRFDENEEYIFFFKHYLIGITENPSELKDLLTNYKMLDWAKNPSFAPMGRQIVG